MVGENHGLSEHQRQQVEIMTQLRSQGHRVAVGMEFFTYTDQAHVDAYRSGGLPEVDFLKTIGWSQPSYDFYREQAIFPNLSEGAKTVALNAPRTLTGKVAKQGLGALTEQEKALLPPQFSLGRDSYKKRFLEMMPHLPNPAAGERYFAAQSIWDDTMAWRATDYIQAHPDQVLVIVVGEFHVRYGGGLPDRIHVRSPNTPVVTFAQVNTADLSESEIQDEVNPHTEYGVRADYIWLAPAQSPGAALVK
ncbi:ChaN family lipoprotein [Bdellovibrio sp. SKB1291214]|uniref:ChaN family lipoprotein n=1 Tax=Bdellovibrio sp. SKB1291214 TaxID=1732569 RepID=UPI0020CBCFD0|nr:ChaN family lipoprotein [Bdellovibrio sp. SKB1291214]UYL07661.1 ChaN family lipoprotein [Bdellovibrio sp. SKB1291214]